MTFPPEIQADIARVDALGVRLRALITADWAQTPPTLQAWYWHWSGDEDDAPVPTSVIYSGFSKKCFVSAGQLGIKQAIDCDEYGGWWLLMVEPTTPKPHRRNFVGVGELGR